MANRQEVLTRVREKYPQYKDVPDDQLASSLSDKYPQYREALNTQGSQEGKLQSSSVAFDQSALPLAGASDAFKQGYEDYNRAAKLAFGDNIIGRNVGKPGGVIGGAAMAAGTVFNPLAKLFEFGKKSVQAIPAELGGDTGYATRTYTGEQPIESGIKIPKSDSGIPLLDVPLNTVGNIAETTTENPDLLLAGLGAKGQAQALKNFINETGRKTGVAATETAARVADSIKTTPEQVIAKGGEIYREILNPKKSDYKKVEIKGGKDLDNSYKLAAEEGLILDKTPENKLDTTRAREQLKVPREDLENTLQEALASKPEEAFNIRELADKTKAKMRDLFENDAEYEAALKEIDKEADAIIRNRGEVINGSELNRVKRGMWSKGYDAMAPNSNKIARSFGNVAKEAIENAYKDADIKAINSRLGEYATLDNLLQGAHGNVIARGKLGKYAAQVIGATAGHSLGLPIAGELGGAWLGGKVSDYLVDPSRITGKMAKKVQEQALKDYIEKSRQNKAQNP